MTDLLRLPLIAMALAGVASVFVLVLYRRAVRRVMLSILNAPVQDDPRSPLANRPPLPITDAAPAPSTSEQELFYRMRHRQRLALAIPLLASAAATLFLALISMDTEEGARGVLKTWGACAIGLVPVLAVAGTGKRRVQRFLIVALVLGVYFAAPQLSKGSFSRATTEAVTLFAPVIVFFVLVMNRYLKTVAPMLLMVTGGGVAGLALGRAAAGFMAPGVASLAVVLVISCAGLAAGILALQRIVRAYERKRTNDHLLLLNMYWLMFTVNLFLQGGYASLLLAVPVFLTYHGVLRLLHRRAEAYALRHGAVELLLLRTFGSQRRSERLLEEIGFRWRHIGPIHLIGGSDLATANLDPTELWQFLRGRTADLAMNAAADVKPDRDGRYRINDFFCFDDTWRATVTSLIDRSQVVLLDARDFLVKNEGVKTELWHLLARKPLESLVVIVDSKHEPALRAAIEEAWQCVDASSVNVSRGDAWLRIVRVDGRGVFDAPRVLSALAAAAGAPAREVGLPSLAMA